MEVGVFLWKQQEYWTEMNQWFDSARHSIYLSES